MTVVHDAADRGENPNVDLVAGLRDLADFLEQHPSLPPVRATAWVPEHRWSEAARANARADLTAVAEALGERATEKQTRSSVIIEGAFGPIGLRAEAQIGDLRTVVPPPVPEYEPIIKREPAAA